jgi:hypothetical protein
MNRRTFLQSTMLTGASYLAPSALWAQPDSAQGGTPKSISIRTQAGTPFAHVWEECSGSDRAVVGLREQWLKEGRSGPIDALPCLPVAILFITDCFQPRHGIAIDLLCYGNMRH